MHLNTIDVGIVMISPAPTVNNPRKMFKTKIESETMIEFEKILEYFLNVVLFPTRKALKAEISPLFSIIVDECPV